MLVLWLFQLLALVRWQKRWQRLLLPAAPVLRALHDTGYAGICGVEPFDYHPDPVACAARAIGYLRGIEEGLAP